MEIDLQRMVKIEERILQIAREDLKLEFNDVEFDIIPPQKMLEIMAYRVPTNISNWKFGRDYEKIRTIHENADAGLPYEVVVNANPSRAYLMNSNPFAVQILVMAHVIGHAAFNKMNSNFKLINPNIVEYMQFASERINEFEKSFGVDEVERIVDAGHALQFHSSPFDNETEEQKRKRIYEQTRKELHVYGKSSFSDFTERDKEKEINEDIALFNQKLWRKLKIASPVEPTQDLLRYIIDNSNILEDWQKYILEILREEGRYYHPIIKTKYMNEGFATYVHEYIMNKLFMEKYLTYEDHAQFNYSNSLVKAMNPFGLNPYLIGSEMWKDIVKRWDKGQHGREWEECESREEKDNWDTGDMKGHEKMLEVVTSYNDWFFMQNFLTNEMVKELQLYIYVMQETPQSYDIVITKHKINEIREMIVNSFSHSRIPEIEVINGNYNNKGELLLVHNWSGIDLDKDFAIKTMKHIYNIWQKDVYLKTKIGNRDVMYRVKKGTSGKITTHASFPDDSKSKKRSSRIWSTNLKTITAMSNIINI